MTHRALRAAAVALVLAGLAACTGAEPAPADTLEAAEAREAAIMRGDTAVAPTDAQAAAAAAEAREIAIVRGETVAAAAGAGDPAAAACARMSGRWSASKRQCAMTESLCVATGSSTWQAGTGCVVPAGDASQCNGFEGLQWTRDQCVLTHLTGQEMADNGF